MKKEEEFYRCAYSDSPVSMERSRFLRLTEKIVASEGKLQHPKTQTGRAVAEGIKFTDRAC